MIFDGISVGSRGAVVTLGKLHTTPTAADPYAATLTESEGERNPPLAASTTCHLSCGLLH